MSGVATLLPPTSGTRAKTGVQRGPNNPKFEGPNAHTAAGGDQHQPCGHLATGGRFGGRPARRAAFQTIQKQPRTAPDARQAKRQGRHVEAVLIGRCRCADDAHHSGKLMLRSIRDPGARRLTLWLDRARKPVGPVDAPRLIGGLHCRRR